MITYLKVRNLAIVEELEIEPGAGFNILTGETGAGKSLLIDSLEFLSGARGSADAIRGGADRMSAEAIFQVHASTAEEIARLGGELDTPDGNGEIVVRRELSSAGRGRVSINGSLLTVRELQGATDSLLEIHGQQDSKNRIAGRGFRDLLDVCGGHAELVDETRAAWQSWKQTADELESLQRAERDRALRIDLLRYQIDEISAARLASGELEKLREERAILANAQALLDAMSKTFASLDDDEESATSRIAHAVQQLGPLGNAIDEVRRINAELEDVLVRLQEVTRDVARIGASVRHDPERLDEVEERLATIDLLARKYGGSVDEILAHLAAITKEHDQLTDFEATAGRLKKLEAEAFEQYSSLALDLSRRRGAAARELGSAVEGELRDLAMERTRVSIELRTRAQEKSRLEISGKGVAFGPEGFDTVELMIAPNAGDDLRPMSKIASGGELSRIQLAIAAATFKHEGDGDATLVFDEIDQGVGGRVAEVVGKKLRELAESNQVICVSHLPQIAALASTHFRVWKEDVSGRTRARIERLDSDDARVGEIARMLGGATVTESARRHATELLESGAASHGKKRARTKRTG